MTQIFPNSMTNMQKSQGLKRDNYEESHAQEYCNQIAKNNVEMLLADRRKHIAYRRMRNKTYHSLLDGNLASHKMTEHHL